MKYPELCTVRSSDGVYFTPYIDRYLHKVTSVFSLKLIHGIRIRNYV